MKRTIKWDRKLIESLDKELIEDVIIRIELEFGIDEIALQLSCVTGEEYPMDELLNKYGYIINKLEQRQEFEYCVIVTEGVMDLVNKAEENPKSSKRKLTNAITYYRTNPNNG